MSFVRQSLWAMVLATSVLVQPAAAQSADQGAFLQVGDGDSKTRSVTLGYVRSLLQPREARSWDVYGEVSLGRWFARAGDDHRAFTQIGLTPVARYSFAQGASGWFVELGVGANIITPVFRSGDRRFSTAFNFGDHVALGRRFGEGHANEIALRIEHYSNGGIKAPNPGEDFVQLRYARHF